MSNKLTDRLAAIVEEARVLSVELSELTELDELTDEQESRFTELVSDESPITALVAEKADIEKRLKVLDAANSVASTEVGEDRSFQFMKQVETRDVDIRTATRGEVRAAALKRLEQEHDDQLVPVSDESAARVEKLIKTRNQNLDGDVIARRLLITETDAYRSAFAKGIVHSQPAWSAEEMQAMDLYRAAEQSLTSASSGYGVPVLIDPTIILTSGAAVAPLLSVSRLESITTNIWKGVSSAGVTFANHSEGAAITAGQATLAQPSITPETAAAFIPYSFEIGGDYPNFAGEMQRLIEQGWVDYLAVETATGSAGLKGIFTAIDAVAASEVTPTTDGQLGPVDAIKVFKALPERYRPRASWFMNISVEAQMRNASALGGLYTTDLSTEGIGPLLGKRVLLSDYAPSFTGTTGASNLAVVGDFGNGFVVVQRVGMSIELIPQVFDGDGLPKGQRGWLAWARAGSDAVDTNAFRLLQNA